ncbi:MAG: 4-hydroxythreonine-4-phosphate dehydrogenase PdxA [Phycisphaerales bacterium]|nr:4-hydroxythreonine-4-phosphate dehydrogenase PdxA [Phycisphaerales bacterium]
MGDPGGIGPEVVVKALDDSALRTRARFRIHGAEAPLARAAQRAGIAPFWWRVERGSALLDTTLAHDVVIVDAGEPGAEFPAAPARRSGELSFQFVEDAIRDVQRREGDPLRAHALATAPISKEAWSLAGHARYPGHTELLATRFGAKRHAMFFDSSRLRVVLVTTHIPLMNLRDALTIGRVFDAIDLGRQACIDLGVARPRVAVCGLNPHAGEHGLLGDEEQRIIEPAVRVATDHGWLVEGPFPGDTVFGRALAGHFDLVVAMYHDQGLIPVKILAFDEAVNITLGLGAPRMSPDHGTAFDIAGKNRANPGSMKRALELAVRMSADQARGHP